VTSAVSKGDGDLEITLAMPLLDLWPARRTFRFIPESRANILASSFVGLYDAKNAEINKNFE
jgi:hypothetical protein